MPTCPQCGIEFVQRSGRGPKRKYCSTECTFRYHWRKGRTRTNKLPAPITISFTCHHCSASIVRPGRRGPLPRFCSPTCRVACNAAIAVQKYKERRQSILSGGK